MGSQNHIAIVGMAGRFPEAPDLDAYFDNLLRGVECTRAFTDEELSAKGVPAEDLAHPGYVRRGAVLGDMEGFDAGFFGFSPRDAAILDPQHRHFLEVSWAALEDAGYDPERFDGSVGVFGGSGHNAYMPYNLLPNEELVRSVGFFLLRHTGNDKDFLTTRVSYCLNLRGPSVAIQTACSTSLVAIHLACQSLLSGECDMALAGGVTIELPHGRGYVHEEGEILSADGRCRAFDHRSDGTFFSSGVGVVVLRRLEDALAAGDTIRAVILGSAINNDGSNKVGYLAPSVDGQAAAVAEAIALADVDPRTISYVEAHGTGTNVGDPIEVAALTQAFRAGTDGSGFCGLGSVKTNIGHSDNAAGVASLIKVARALEAEELPGTLHFEAPNPSIDFGSTPFFVQAARAAWPREEGRPRRAGVNSLGVGGTNAFVVLEEAPAPAESEPGRHAWELLVTSARTAGAADHALERLGRHLARHPEASVADVAHTLQVGRRGFAHRRAVLARGVADAAAAVEARDPARVLVGIAPDAPPKVVFMFPGGGAQHAGMGRELFDREPVYRAELERCLALLAPRVGELRPLVFPPAGEREAASLALERPRLSLPVLFATEWALAALWRSWGVTPAAMIGHSMGEYTAACLAGVFSLEDALALVSVRGELFEKVEPGGMLSVPLSARDLEPHLGDHLSMAAINGSELTVASGPDEAIAELQRKLERLEIDAKRIHIAIAAHSGMLEPILPEFARFTRTIRYAEPKLPFASNVTGKLATARDATDPEYWVRHLRAPVRFADGLDAILADGSPALLEVGPGRALSTFGRARALELGRASACVTSLPHAKETTPEVEHLTGALGRLWVAGVDVDFAAYRGDERRRRVPLPSYPFEHQRHWVEPPARGVVAAPRATLVKKPDVAGWFYVPSFERAPLVPREPVPRRVLVVGGGDRAFELCAGLRGRGHSVVQAGQGGDADVLSVDPRAAEDLDRLWERLRGEAGAPDVVIFAAALEPERRGGFAELLALGQALGRREAPQAVELVVLTTRSREVGGEAVLHPEGAIAAAAARVLMHEVPSLGARAIDLEDPAAGPDVARAIADEIEELPADRVIALRGPHRFRERFVPLSLPAQGGAPSLLRERGVYLITGGLGGIGLCLAEHLARTRSARLVLVGRTRLPAPAARAEWLTSHDPDDPMHALLRRLEELERSGAEVLVASADVTDPAALRAVIAEARDRFGSIDGVFHTAGVLDDGVVALETLEAAERVLAPKVAGAAAIDAALGDAPVDFVLYFSSVSAITGLAGQFDYAAANAFLDAYAEARARRTGQPSFAVGWNAWRDVGMAAGLASSLGLSRPTPRAPAGRPTGHPWLDRAIFDTTARKVYASLLSPDTHWVLGEHALRGGDPVLPGTAYLELARAALAEAEGAGPSGPGPAHAACELADWAFVAPLSVPSGEAVEVRVSLERRGEGWDVAVTSGPPGDRVEHARGLARRVAPQAPRADVAAIAARCSRQVRERFDLAAEPHVAFGERWDNRRTWRRGEREALLELRLPEALRGDVQALGLHPALLDFATAGGQELVPGFDARRDFYVPLSYGAVQVHACLPDHVLSRIELTKVSPGAAVYDVDVLDPAGRVLVEVREFTMQRVEGRSLRTRRATGPAKQATANKILELGLEAGIRTPEGMEAIERILRAPRLTRVVVSSQDLGALLESTRPAPGTTPAEGAARAPGGSVRTPRPPLATAFVAPETPLQRTIAAVWEELLGVEGVGLHDDFFDLGGHSLLLTQLASRVRKRTQSEVSLRSLFERRTVDAIARQIEAALQVGGAAGPKLQRVSRDAFRVARSTLTQGADRDESKKDGR